MLNSFLVTLSMILNLVVVEMAFNHKKLNVSLKI